MRYYKDIDEYGRVRVVGIGEGHTEITEEEYERLKYEMYAKSDLADEVYHGEITLESVPVEWRGEIQEMVDWRIDEFGTADEQDISAAEALSIILGGADR